MFSFHELNEWCCVKFMHHQQKNPRAVNIRTSLYPFWPFPAWLSSGCGGHGEQEGTTRTQRVHDVIRGSGTAASHCVIVYSAARSCPIFWCCLENTRSQCLFLCCRCLYARSSTHKLLSSHFLTHTHKSRGHYCPVDIAKGPMHPLLSQSSVSHRGTPAAAGTLLPPSFINSLSKWTLQPWQLSKCRHRWRISS